MQNIRDKVDGVYVMQSLLLEGDFRIMHFPFSIHVLKNNTPYITIALEDKVKMEYAVTIYSIKILRFDKMKVINNTMYRQSEEDVFEIIDKMEEE